MKNTENLNNEEYEKLQKFHKSLQSKFLDHTKCMIQFQFLTSALKQLKDQDTFVGIAK